MLSAIVFLPALAAAGLLAVPARAPRAVFGWAWAGVSAADLALVVAAWAGYQPHGGFGWTEDARWIPSAGVGYHVGVDGLSLPLLAMTAVLFLAVAVYSLRETRRPKSYACLFLFLQAVCLGLFTALDLILFFVYFDLSIVGMYFVIAGWGHGERARAAALKFFLLGSPFSRSKLRPWLRSVAGCTTHARSASSRPGSAPMLTAWTTWSGCAGHTGSNAPSATASEAGGRVITGSCAPPAGTGPR